MFQHVSAVALQDRELMDRSRAMKVVAAAGNGDHVQVRTKSIVLGSADGIDSSRYFFRVNKFSGLLWRQPCTEPPRSEGAMGGVQRLSSCMPTARSLWAYLFSSTTCSEGVVCGSASMCDGPHAGLPRRATLAAPKGEWPYTEETPSGAALTSPPEGVFRQKRLMELDELLGRTTGRLGYTWPTTAY